MSAVRERLLAWLLVLPALLFATPLSPLVHDPYPHLAGTGWAVWALLPLAALVLADGAPARAAWPFVLALAWGLVSWSLAPPTDTFEARRALAVLAVLPLALAGGAALGARGRATFAALCVGLACLWTGGALWSGLADGHFAGVLGDTGSLSQAALGGAAIGAVWLARERGTRRALGGLALALFLAHVAAAPVLAGSHTLLAALLLAAGRAPGRGRGTLAALALGALIAPFAGLAAREWLTGAAPASLEGAPATPGHSLGGLGVRGLVWRASLGLVAEHPFLGAGPGQFQAAFPPYRDPREIELSRHGRCSELDTEVEHAHNDWLQAFCELGLPGGLAFALGLALLARAALRSLRDEQRLPLAVAALALLVNGFVHAPFTGNPAASVLAFGLFGALPAGPAASGSRRRWQAAILALPCVAAAGFALPLVVQGRALGAHLRALAELDLLRERAAAGEPVAEPRELRRAAEEALERACAAAPEAAPVRLQLARGSGAVEAWDAVLAVRPHAVEALEQSGTELARAGRTGAARERYARALALSPTHPRILRNAARLELTQGELARGLAHVEQLRAEGCLEPGWLAGLGTELVLALGRPAEGARLLFERALEELAPEALHAHGLEEERDERWRAAAECLAQLRWARQHAAAGDFELALRNYRQAHRRSQVSPPGAAPLYALELAAAELRAGRREEARAHVEGLRPDRRTWLALPPWAREALTELGLAPET